MKGLPMKTRNQLKDLMGYSLIELLVVLAIIGILSIVGVSMLGNRGGNSVRAVLDELEGGIMDAHKFAAATGRDVAIVTWGQWDPTGQWDRTGATALMMMARGAASQTSAAIQTVATTPPASPTDAEKTVAAVFVPSRSREYMHAGVVTNGSTWWTNAMQVTGSGRQNENITTVEPFQSDASFQAANTAANNLFQGALNQVTISGANKRFNASFVVQVVSTSGGFAIPGGAMGLIVVLNNGGTVYKFYNSGVANGDGRWRRI